MPDDDRTRRRLGDETKERIADLASGWTVEPSKDAAPAPADANEVKPRKKPRTNPPPPPGSAERKALEQAIVETKTADIVRVEPDVKPEASDKVVSAEASGKLPKAETRPPKPPSAPPPIPRAKSMSPPPIPAIPASPAVTKEPADAGQLTVPIGEFDTGTPTVDEEKLRIAYHQATIKRSAADALLQIPGQPPTVVKETPIDVLLGETVASVRGDPTAIDPSTSPFERGDATTIDPHDGATRSGGTLRASAALRRKRGLVGDVYYVFTALFGVRRSRRELAALEQRQVVRQASRRHHLVTLGRTAVTADAFDHPALGKARDRLQAAEEERSMHAGAVAAADNELARVTRSRDAKAKQHVVDLAAIDVELAELAKKLEPLDKEVVAARRRATELGESLQRIAKTITETEGLLVSVKADKMDRAGIQAEIATLKADRLSVQRDEPVIAAELDALNPRIAAIEAARAEAISKRTALDKAEREDQRRSTELLEAIGAKRKVVERAAAEAELARDAILFELGDRLYVDRPTILGAQLAPIDQIDLELGESDRRVMELREILSNIDRAKVARGAAVIGVVVAVLATMIGWLIYMLA